MNVQLAWEQNITGQRSVVSILDDGMWLELVSLPTRPSLYMYVDVLTTQG